jgi:A/G-specific adenine glycosylase
MTRARRQAVPLPVSAVLASANFSKRLLAWQAKHGRSGLPWQGQQDPYRVWLSEIMLQQTQVETVKAYYARFLKRFPTIEALADAPQDDVLALWAGLGYYSRARNLHACAQIVVRAHDGQFPQQAQLLQQLPGIGSSTAAAIAAFCFGERVSILDGNVKRVLTRVLAFEHDLSRQAHEKQLWQIAQRLVPTRSSEMPRYTQALMDLGATVCSTRSPSCLMCPMQGLCAAQQQQRQQAFPVKTKRIKRSSQTLWLLWARKPSGEVFLQRRASKGVWAGLHCLPLFDTQEALLAALSPAQRRSLVYLPAFVHALTHKDLHLHPVQLNWRSSKSPQVPDDDQPQGQWVSAEQLQRVGLPAPVAKLLQARAL